MVFNATFNSISVTSISWWLYILYTLLFYNIFFYEILVPVCHVHFEELNEYDVYYYNWTSNRHICSNIPPNQLKCGSEYTTISVVRCTVLSRNSLLLGTHNQASQQVNGTESIHCGSEHHHTVDRQSVFWVHTNVVRNTSSGQYSAHWYLVNTISASNIFSGQLSGREYFINTTPALSTSPI